MVIDRDNYIKLVNKLIKYCKVNVPKATKYRRFRKASRSCNISLREDG